MRDSHHSEGTCKVTVIRRDRTKPYRSKHSILSYSVAKCISFSALFNLKVDKFSAYLCSTDAEGEEVRSLVNMFPLQEHGPIAWRNPLLSAV